MAHGLGFDFLDMPSNIKTVGDYDESNTSGMEGQAWRVLTFSLIERKIR